MPTKRHTMTTKTVYTLESLTWEALGAYEAYLNGDKKEIVSFGKTLNNKQLIIAAKSICAKYKSPDSDFVFKVFALLTGVTF